MLGPRPRYVRVVQLDGNERDVLVPAGQPSEAAVQILAFHNNSARFPTLGSGSQTLPAPWPRSMAAAGEAVVAAAVAQAKAEVRAELAAVAQSDTHGMSPLASWMASADGTAPFRRSLPVLPPKTNR